MTEDERDLLDLVHDRLMGLDDGEGTYKWSGIAPHPAGLMVSYGGSTYRLILEKAN